MNALKSIFHQPTGNLLIKECLNRTLSSTRSFSDVGVVGVPMSRGQPKHGVDQGPSVMRKSGFIEELKELGTVKDYGDLKFHDIKDDPNFGMVKNPRYIGAAMKKVASSVQNVLSECKTCLNIGGDHSVGIGSVFGHAQVHSNVSVIWVDAHADINTPTCTTTGNIHGMSVSFLLNELSDQCSNLPGFEWIHPSITGKNIAYIGLREVEEQEKQLLKNLGIATFSMREVDRLGIYEVIKQALEAVDPTNDRSIHVSFDIDSVDKNIVPSTGTSVIGGLNAREALCIAEEFSATDRVRVLDLVEVNPSLGSEEDVAKTTEMASRIVLGFFGKLRGGNLPRRRESATE